MSYTFTKYKSFAQKQYNGNAIDFDTDTIKVALVTSSYTPDIDHDFFNDITNEVSGDNYTAGGATLANVTWTFNGGLSAYIFDADDVQWAEDVDGFENGYRVILYKEQAGSPAASPLIAYGSAMSPALSNKNGNATLRWAANGIFGVPV